MSDICPRGRDIVTSADTLTLTPVSVIHHGDVVHPRRAPVLQPHRDVHLDVGLDHGAAAAGHLNTDNELHCAGLLTVDCADLNSRSIKSIFVPNQ